MLWHIMNIYSSQGFNEFVLALGYKGETIKRYFLDFYYHQSDFKVTLKSGRVDVTNKSLFDWTVELIDTGEKTLTGGRLGRLKAMLQPLGTFMLTYGDGVANVDVRALAEFHKRHGKLATVTSVRPPARFGAMSFEGERVVRFKEKPQTGEGWINGGFFVFEPGVFDYIKGDTTILEQEPLENLANDGQLMSFKHEGFWQPMDTLRDKTQLEEMWANGNAPWKVWQ